MNKIPDTTPTCYLTGSSALNIPSEEGDFSDWHFTETFLGNKTTFRVAGQNFVDTNPLLGDYGIRECSNILRRHGLPIESDRKVYAANFVRATLDLVYKNIAENRLPSHLRLDDIFDDDTLQHEFLQKLQQLKSQVSDSVKLTLINQWEQQQ